MSDRVPAREIKRDLLVLLQRTFPAMRHQHLKVRWGTGTARHYLDVLIANEFYEFLQVAIVEGYLEDNWDSLGMTFWDSDWDDERRPAYCVTNFDGVYRMNWDVLATSSLPGITHNWQQEGF